MRTRKARVLFLSQEMSLKGIKRRVRKLFNREEANAFAQNVRILFKHSIRIDSDAGADALRQLIESANLEMGGPVDLVIIDALSDIKGSAKEDSNDDMGAALRRVRDRVAEPLNCCVLVVHHKGKPPDSGNERGGRGASAIEDPCGEVIYLDHPKEGPRIGTFAKTRDDEVAPFAFSISDDTWPDGSRRILLTIEDGGEATQKATDALLAEPTAAVWKLLRKMRERSDPDYPPSLRYLLKNAGHNEATTKTAVLEMVRKSEILGRKAIGRKGGGQAYFPPEELSALVTLGVVALTVAGRTENE